MTETGLTRKTVILAGYRCNNRCIFCMEALKRDIPVKTTRQILSEIASARNRGSTYLELIGGESTIREDIFTLIGFAKKMGYETIMMSTNGRMFSYPDFCRKIVDAGLTDIVFSIHGHTARLHDSLTRVRGSFRQLVRGIENIKAIGFKRIGANTAIVKPNMRFLSDIGRLLIKYDIRSAEFIFVDPNEGGAKRNFNRLVPRISKAAVHMRKLLDLGIEHDMGWTVRYVPLCYFLGYEDRISELHEVEMFHTEHLAPEFSNFDVEGSRRLVGRVRTERCRPCILLDRCEGIWKTYVERYGDSELRPVMKATTATKATKATKATEALRKR